MRSLFIAIHFFLILFTQPILAQKNDSTLQGKLSKSFTPKFSLNISFGYGNPFGSFSKVGFSNATTAKELEHKGYTEGGFADRGAAYDISIGIRVRKNWGILGRIYQSEYGVNEKKVKEEFSIFYPDSEVQKVEGARKVTTYTIGYYKRNRFNKMKRVFYEYRGSIGIAYSRVPIFNIKAGKFDPILGAINNSLLLNVPARSDFESRYEKVSSPVFIGGGSIGYAPSRFFAVALSTDILISRAVYKDVHIGSGTANPQTRTFSQLITSISSNLQLSFFF
jgi:hypothetical protein